MFASSCYFLVILLLVFCFVFFFFSSRRRHTRCLSDWSSDVCSSDLAIRWGLSGELIHLGTHAVRPARAAIEELIEWVQPVAEELGAAEFLAVQIGRASCRERVEISVVGEGVKEIIERSREIQERAQA